MTRLEALLKAFGLQGGTIHQIAELTGLSSYELLFGLPTNKYLYSDGILCSVMNSTSLNVKEIFPTNKGIIDFWCGVIDGVRALENKIGPRLWRARLCIEACKRCVYGDFNYILVEYKDGVYFKAVFRTLREAQNFTKPEYFLIDVATWSCINE